MEWFSSCISRWKNSREFTWSELLTLRGPALWTARHEIFVCQDKEKAQDCVYLCVGSSSKQPQQRVCVICQASYFQIMERERGMEKPEAPQTTASVGGCPLTKTVGDEWTRQRSLMTQALSDIKERSLRAVASVNYDEIDKNSSTIVDLKKVLMEASAGWVVRLFRGHAHDTNKELAESFLSFWHEIRALQKNTDSTNAARTAFTEALQRDINNGLFRCIYNSGLSPQDALSNCVNAMTTAFETTFSLVFWTIWNLAREDGTWDKCRRELSLVNQIDSDFQPHSDLPKLALLKKLATEGKLVDIRELSYLGRALVETVRVYPPVWTLPRSYPGSDAISAKLDVATTNCALHRDWNPDRPDSIVSIASFGVGKRHCPAGTAALFAAHSMIRRFVMKFERPRECEPDKALRSTYLGPTLCMEGPQFFTIQLAICLAHLEYNRG